MSLSTFSLEDEFLEEEVIESLLFENIDNFEKIPFYFGGKKRSFFAPKTVCQKCFFTTREEILNRPPISEVFLFYPENDGQKKKIFSSHRFQGTEKKH